MSDARLHPPAMVPEVVQCLGCAEKPRGLFVDMTVGTGGHSAEILKAAPQARLIGIDRDPAALKVAAEQLASFADRAMLIHGDYRDVQRLIAQTGHQKVDGCLIDPGMSLWQVDGDRGFSFGSDCELDMRYDVSQAFTARHLVNESSREELEHIFEEGGEGRRTAQAIANAIVVARQHHRIETADQLAAIITATVKSRNQKKRLHPATIAFMAVRMAVNDEADALKQGTKAAINTLLVGGRLVVLTYQSIEDRIVKQVLKQQTQPRRDGASLPSRIGDGSESGNNRISLLAAKPVVPALAEARQNPRARSCKLRAAERIE